MAKLSKAIFKGLGQGLDVYGRGLLAEAEKEREDERLDKLDAFKERELSIREKESALNQQRMEIANQQAKTKYNHGRFVAAVNQSEGDPDQLASAFSTLNPDGIVYKNNSNAAQADIMNPATGKMQKPYAVFDLSTFETNDKGEPVVLPNGKKKEIPMKLNDGKKIFWTKDELMHSAMRKANQDEFMAIELAKMTGNDVRDMEAKAIEAKAKATAKTELGRADIELKKSQAAENRANAERLTREKKSGGDTAVSVEKGFNAFADDLRAKYTESNISTPIAKKIDKVFSDKDTRKKFQANLALTVGPEAQYSKQDFIDAGIKDGLPREFLEDMYTQAEIASEARGVEEKNAIGSDGWFNGVVNSFMGLFK